MTAKVKTVSMTAEYNLHKVADSISYLPEDVVLDFIKELDGMMADYGFTKKLRDYCIKEIKNEDAARGGGAP